MLAGIHVCMHAPLLCLFADCAACRIAALLVGWLRCLMASCCVGWQRCLSDGCAACWLAALLVAGFAACCLAALLFGRLAAPVGSQGCGGAAATSAHYSTRGLHTRTARLHAGPAHRTLHAGPCTPDTPKQPVTPCVQGRFCTLGHALREMLN